MNGFSLSTLAERLSRHSHGLLLGHLLILHALAFGGWHFTAVRLLWPVAVGLLLLWQPFVEGERELSRGQGAVLFALVVALVVWMNPWFLLIWCGALAAIIGGRVLWRVQRRERLGYLLAFGYLICLSILGVVPEIAPRAVTIDPWLKDALAAYLPVVLPVLLLFPARQPRRRAGDAFDFFYSLLVFLILAVFFLGSLAHMLVADIGYLEAVVQTSLSLAGGLLLLAWAWNPRGGFSGIGSAFSRYLLSVGMPLEQWLVILNEESERQTDPERFLAGALARLAELPWVVGGGVGSQWPGRRLRPDERIPPDPRPTSGPPDALLRARAIAGHCLALRLVAAVGRGVLPGQGAAPGIATDGLSAGGV